MKAVKDKDALQQIFDSWSASSNNLWEASDCGMRSTVKMFRIWHQIKHAELIQSGLEYKGVPHLLCPIESDASSTVSSTCQSNDSDGEQGTVSDHSVNDDPIPMPSSEQINLSTASNTIKTGRVNVNTGHGNVSSGRVHVNSVSQFKSGASRFNTGKQHVNSGSVHVNSGTQIKSGSSRFNTGKLNVNSGSSTEAMELELIQKLKYFLLKKSVLSCPLTSDAEENQVLLRWLVTLISKNLNKLVNGNLVRGLPSKSFKNAPHCVACQKESNTRPPEVDGKSDEGFLVGYSVNSKAFRVYNLVTKRVEVNLHVNFLEEKPNVQGIGHRWMFDLDYLTDSMNYIPVSVQNQANPAGSKEVIDIDVQTEEDADLMVVSSTSLSEKIATKKTHSPRQPSSTPISKSADDIMTFRKELDALALKHLGPVPTTVPTSTNPVNTGSINLNTAFEEVNTGNAEAISPSADHEEEVFSDADDDEMPEIRIYDKSSEGIFEKASYDDDGIITDFNNLPDEVDVSTNPTLRISTKLHPQAKSLEIPNTTLV
ncbi:hypothetical protein Tco_0487486 [Tanacetum coccineum]